MKVFVLISAGIKLADEPYLNIERYNKIDGKYEFGCTEKFLKAYLAGLAWIPKEEYLPFIENAAVGEMCFAGRAAKEMIVIIRLKDYEEENHE
jgi:hypothetical protein